MMFKEGMVLENMDREDLLGIMQNAHISFHVRDPALLPVIF